MNLQILFLFAFHLLTSTLCVETKHFNMILSFVKYDNKPLSLLTPDLCWSRYELNTLTKMLNDAGVNMAQSLQPNRTEFYLQHIMVLADMSCPGIPKFLLTASDKGYFKAPYRWLLLDLDNRGDKLALLKNLEMPVNSDVVVARETEGQRVLFIEAYRISEKFDTFYTIRSIWRPVGTKSNVYNESFRNSDTPIIPKSNRTEDTNRTSVTAFKENQTEMFGAANETDIAIGERRRKAKTVAINKYGVIEDYRDVKILFYRRNNLRRHPLTMVNVITDSNETRNHLDDRLQLHRDSIAKISYMPVKLCFEMLNATEKLIFTHTWGYKDKNGNWEGSFNYLIKNEADLGTIGLFTQDRIQVVDYVGMIGTTALRFVFREPPLAYVSNIFTLPFTGGVWLAIIVCVIACAIFLYITSRWEATMGLHPIQLDGSWADVLILIIGAVLQQGCTLEPRHAAGRCVTLLLFIALTILYSAYSANIVVLLRAPSSSVRTLQDLLNSPLKFGASDFEYNRYFFKKLNEPIRKAIYDTKIAPKGKMANYYSMQEGVEKIRKGLFAFHMELNPGYRLVQETYQEDEKCDLVEIDYLNEIDPWLPGRKRSPFNEFFKINFLKIRESGIQSCIHHRIFVPRPKCSGTISTFSSVGITDMYGALLATLYGMMLAPAVLMFEIAYNRLVMLKQKRKLIRLKQEGIVP